LRKSITNICSKTIKTKALLLGYNSTLPLINLLIHSNHEARTNIQDKTIKAKAKVAQLGEGLRPTS